MLRKIKIPKLIRLVFFTGIIFLLLMSLLRLILFLFFNKQGNSLGQLTHSFLLGFRYDARDVSIILLPLLVICSFSYFNPFTTNRGKTIWFSWLTVMVVVLLLAYALDFAYYDYLNQRLNASVLNFLQDASISFSMVWQTYPVIRMLLAIIVIAWLLMYALRKIYAGIHYRYSVHSRVGRIIWFVLCFLVLALGIFGRIGQYPLRWSDAFTLGSDYKANLALNPMESFTSTLSFRHNNIDPATISTSFAVIAKAMPLTVKYSDSLDFRRTIRPANPSHSPNVVLVICESFSAYKSSMWGNPLNTTPFFNEMCRQGIFFDRCFTPSYGTARGVWATITGIPDVQYPNTSSRNPLIVDQHTIMNDYKDYDKFYFIGGSTSWANIRGLLSSNINGLNLYEQENFDAPKIDVWGISDKNLFLSANSILAKREKPFFAVIQTADNHRPYSIPSEDLADFKKLEFPKDSLTKYGFESNDEMNAFRYTDFCFQKFIEAAKKEKYFTNTIFVFVGDHGIPGEAENMFPTPWTSMRLANMHVPLLFYSPSLLSPLRSHMICSQIDVLPTIAGLTRTPYTNSALGRDLLDSNHFDSPARQFAFLFDVDMKMIGLAQGDYLFRKQLNGSGEDFVSIIGNDPVVKSAETDSARKEMLKLTDAFYNISHYLLFHNKKEK